MNWSDAEKKEKRHQEDLDRLRSFRPMEDVYKRQANHKKVYPVGTCTTPDDQIARIEALARKRRR